MKDFTETKTSNTKAINYELLLCGVCDSSEHKIALTENEIKVCTDCAKWIQKRAEKEGNLPQIQLHIDTKYIALNAT